MPLRVSNEVMQQVRRQMTEGELIALLQKIQNGYDGDEDLHPQELFRRIRFEDAVIRVEDAVPKLVDKSGRIIPLKGMGVAEESSRHRFIQQGDTDLSAIYRRLVSYFPAGTVFVSELEYIGLARELLAEVGSDKQMNNLLKRFHLPLPLPKICVGDYGEILEQVFLPSVSKSYTNQFPNRQMNNWLKGDLAGNVIVLAGRQQELFHRVRQGPLVGIYFPDPLRGFGIEDSRKVVRHLPRGYSLSGGFEAAIAYTATPQVLAHGDNTPVTDCAALCWQSSSSSLCFNSYDMSLDFRHRQLNSSSYCSAGLLFTR